MTVEEIKAIMAETARLQKETAKLHQEYERERKERAKEAAERDKKWDEKMDKLEEQIGGISKSNGDFAEEFFYNSLKETMTFAGVHFDVISDKFGGTRIMPDKTRKEAQFDIVLHNGNSLALIEVKYKANLKDVREMVEKKLPNFRLIYPQFAKYKLYLGIGSLVLKDRIIQEAKKLGIGLMEQRGDAVEHKTNWVRVY